MNDPVAQFKQMMDDVARSGALTPEAIRQFDAMRSTVEDQAKALESERKRVNDMQDSLRKSESKVSTLEAGIKERDTELTGLRALKASAEKSVWIAEFEKDRRAEMRSIVHDVFRNAEVRSTMTGTAPPASSASPTYYPPQNVPVSENRTVSQE